MGSRQIGPRQIGSLYYIYLYWVYSANNWGNICQMNLYIGIGYIGDIWGYMPFAFGIRVGEIEFMFII